MVPRPTVFDVDGEREGDDGDASRRGGAGGGGGAGAGRGGGGQGGRGGRGGGGGGAGGEGRARREEAVAQQLVAIFPNMTRQEAIGRARQARGSIERAVDAFLSSSAASVGGEAGTGAAWGDDNFSGGFVRSEVHSVGRQPGTIVRRRWFG